MMTWTSRQPVSPLPDKVRKCKNECPAGINDCPVYLKYQSLKKAYRRLKKFSIRDELTGYYNYSFLMTTLGNEMERTRRSGLPCCIILADIDHFKTINDVWGHESGNLALKAVTGLWKKNIRQVDYPCRYGGEEFLFILPNEKLANAIHTAERLREKLAQHPFRFKKNQVRLTASFGVCEYNGLCHHSPGELIEKADHFLYQAKQTGRNQTFPKGSLPSTVSHELSLDERMALCK
jgi:diguanylate cyclase (GGDEF)-like protein